MNAKNILSLLATTLLTVGAHATLFTYQFNSGFQNGGVIPDGNPNGWSDTRNLSGIDETITDVNVTLNISGGWNGDLYGYLVHDSGFAVLLNRVGKTSGNAFGYSDAGFNITLDGAAANGDIHLYRDLVNPNGGTLTGTWQEDGRQANPATVTDESTRSASLSSFNGLSANGSWTLFLADLSADDTSTLVSWGLEIEAVPEPTTWALIAFAMMAGVVTTGRWLQRRLHSNNLVVQN